MTGASAAFFDLDKTIIATSSSTAFSRTFLEKGLLTRADALRTAYAQFIFLVGSADDKQTNRLRDALADLIEGWEVAKVKQIVEETIHDHIDPVVYDEALELIRRHQANGRRVVIVSASSRDIVEPIAKLLGADDVIASEIEVKDGRYTGQISYYAFGPAKAEAMRELAARDGVDLERSYAYSDSITDAPMLNVVGHGFAVNPDRNMRRAAQANGWGVLRFRKPVALRSGAQTGGTVAGLVLLALVIGTLVVLMRAASRRSKD
jgi:HAD superfamily hydrolase (TIGR01490 family)